MTKQEVLDLINEFIVANGSNEITANVLRPILTAILTQPNNYIGDLEQLNTVEQSDLVSAINELAESITTIANGGVKLHEGINNPNDTTPSSYSIADFYIQKDTFNNPIQLWQFNGISWIEVGNNISFNAFAYPDKKFFYAGSNSFNLPNNVQAISVRKNGGPTDVNIEDWGQLGNVVTYLGTLEVGDYLIIGGIYNIEGGTSSGSVISVTDDDNGVVSVDNSNPANPIIKFNGVFVDGTTVTGNGTEENPLASLGGGGGVTINDETPSLIQTYSSEKSEDTFVKRSGTEVGKPVTGDVEIGDTNGISTEEIDGMRSRIFCDSGRWYINILGVDTNLEFQFNPDKGILSNKLFDIDNDEKVYLQKGHIVQLEEDVFNLELNKANQDTTYTKTEVDAKVASVYKIRGSVANFASLPSTGQLEGDVWNLLDNGDNYAWVLDLNNTGVAGWDKLSGSVDLTAYETKVVAESKYLQIVNASATVLATLLSGISFLTGGAIVSTDSVLVAFGKIQKNITDIFTALDLKAPLANPTFTGSVIVPNATNNNEAVALGQVLKNQITKSGNQTLDDTYNGKVVTFTGSGTFTVNDTIAGEGSFALKVETGVTVAWAITAPATWRVGGLTVGTAPRSLVGGDMVYIARKGSSNEIEVYGI